ncbi:MAG: EVE domain-containing protein [Chthoniobacterales bacterium]
MANHWLVKSEPSAYSWADLIREKQTAWTGVRNFQARNNLRAMKKGDLVLFYQSVIDPSVRGITKVVKEAYPDPTAKEGDWSSVDLAAVKPLPSPVTLQEIKGEKSLAEISLIKQSRLSVMPIAPWEYEQILGMGSI